MSADQQTQAADVANGGGDQAAEAANPTHQQAAQNAAGSTGNAGGGEFSPEQQARVDAIVTDRLKRAEKAQQKAIEDAVNRARQEEREAAAQAAREAEMTELEKANEALTALKAEADAAKASAAVAELARARAELIAQDPDAAALPAAYKAQVAGDTPEALAESLTAVKAAFEADRAAWLAQATGKPPSLGTQSNTNTTPLARDPDGPLGDSLSAWTERGRRRVRNQQ